MPSDTTPMTRLVLSIVNEALPSADCAVMRSSAYLASAASSIRVRNALTPVWGTPARAPPSKYSTPSGFGRSARRPIAAALWGTRSAAGGGGEAGGDDMA